MSEFKSLILNKAEHPAPMPEVLTETEQAFADFVMRNTVPSEKTYVDSYDYRNAELSVGGKSRQLIPIEKIEIETSVRLELDNGLREPEFVPFNQRSVEFKSKFYDLLPGLCHDSISGWLAHIPEYGNVEVSEDYAKQIVDNLLQLEEEGLLQQS